MRVKTKEVKVKGERVPVDREKLLLRLEQVAPGLATREIIQQASCFIFAKGKVITFNEEVACSVKSTLPKDFTGAVPAKPLLDFLRKIPVDELMLEYGGQQVVITAKKRRLELVCDPHIVLPVDTVDTPEDDWKKLSEHFLPAITLVEKCAGKDMSSVWVNVHITPKFIEACDNDMMARYRCKTPISGSVLVRRNAIRQLPGLELEHIQESNAWLHFKSNKGLVVSLRRYDDTYPTLDKFFAISGSPVQLPKTMIESLGIAEIFSSENPDENLVTLSLKRNELTITGIGTHGKYTEPVKLKYKGPDLNFAVNPAVLSEIIKKHSECELAESHKLKVANGRFEYVAALLENADTPAPDAPEETDETSVEE